MALPGSNGVIGHIGWFIPTYLMKEHPEFKTWQGLKGKESICDMMSAIVSSPHSCRTPRKLRCKWMSYD